MIIELMQINSADLLSPYHVFVELLLCVFLTKNVSLLT